MRTLFSTIIATGLCILPVTFNEVHAAEKNEAPATAAAPAANSNSNAQSSPDQLELDHPGLMDRMMFKLGLSKEQKQKIQAIRQTKREKAEALRSEQKTKLAALQSALKSGSDDDVRKAFAALQTSHQSLAALHLEGMLETRALLTPEQRNTFAGMSLHHLGEGRRGGRR